MHNKFNDLSKEKQHEILIGYMKDCTGKQTELLGAKVVMYEGYPIEDLEAALHGTKSTTKTADTYNPTKELAPGMYAGIGTQSIVGTMPYHHVLPEILPGTYYGTPGTQITGSIPIKKHSAVGVSKQLQTLKEIADSCKVDPILTAKKATKLTAMLEASPLAAKLIEAVTEALMPINILAEEATVLSNAPISLDQLTETLGAVQVKLDPDKIDPETRELLKEALRTADPGKLEPMFIQPEVTMHMPSEEMLQILHKLKAKKADMYVLRLKPGMHHSRLLGIQEAVHKLLQSYNIKAPVVVLPAYTELVGYSSFSFHEALELLKGGYRVQREGWDGYIYMQDGIIYHSNDNKEWKPTQKALLAQNWRLYY